MVAALAVFQAQHAVKFEIELVDVDFYAPLEAQYGDKVPVLLIGGLSPTHENVELCHYYLNDAKLLAHVIANSAASDLAESLASGTHLR